MQNQIYKNSGKPLLVITGQYQNGKSTFLNCLLGGHYAVEGKGLITTKYNAKYCFGDYQMLRVIPPVTGSLAEKKIYDSISGFFSAQDSIREYDKNSLLEITAYSPMLEHIDLLDSPGCGANDEDDSVAEAALTMADFVLFIVQKDINIQEMQFMKKICCAGKHFSIILNCWNDLDPDSDEAKVLTQTVFAKLQNNNELLANYVSLSKKYPVYPVNLLWAQCALGYQDAELYQKRMKQVGCSLGIEQINPFDLLQISNFLSVREMIKKVIHTFFNYTPYQDYHILRSVADSWTTELVNILKEK